MFSSQAYQDRQMEASRERASTRRAETTAPRHQLQEPLASPRQFLTRWLLTGRQGWVA